MIVRFDDIKLDSYGRLERPTLFIHTLTGEPICPVSNFYDLDVEFRFNDVSEISFQIPDRYIDGTEVVHNDSYDEIRGFRMLRMEPFGAFIIQNPQITDNGMAKVKSVTCYSLEYELNYKNMPPLDTTYMFYDPTGESKDTIMNIILEKVPNWKIGHVDTNVATRYRTFDNNGESIYQFMVGTLQESYSCVFLFDTDNRTINVYDSSNAIKNVPLFLSTKNLVKDLQAEELANEIVTCLSVYGANDVSISSVNPIGSDKIYNLDYFVEIGDIPDDLAAKWKKWKKDYEIYQGVFSDVFSQYFTTQVLLNNELAILAGLQEELESLEHVLDAMQTDTGGDHAAEIAETKTEIAQKTTEVNNQQAKVDAQNSKLEALYNSLDQIYGFCAFDKYFTVDELKMLNLYFKEDSIQEATYVVSYVNDEPSSCNAISSSNPITITIDKGDLYRSDEYTDLTQDNINELDLPPAELAELQNIINGVSAEHLNNYFFKINLGAITVADANKTLDIAGTVVNSTLSYSKTANVNGNYDCVVSFYINEPKSQSEEFLGATNVLMVISGEMTAFQYNNIIDSDTTDTMSFNLVGGVMTLTFDSTIYQRQNTIQDLFDYGTETLSKLAYPSYNFSIDSANFMTLPEFDHFKKDIQLGRSMNIEFKDGVFLQPIFIGLSMSFDDVTQFTLEFSDKFNSSNPEFPLADVIGKSAQTSANLDANKFSYAAFENSNIKNDVENIISSALDISKKNIINSKDQSLLIDDGGIHLRKLIDKANNRFDPCEVRLTNNQIVFTDDAWETAGLAIGKLTVNTDGTDKDFMGIVAQNLIGQVIVGNKLAIEATGVDQVTGQPNVTHFRVDGSGAYLGNASFAIQGKPRDSVARAVIEGNKILLDPNYGIIAGDSSIFSIGSNGVVANFIDETGNVVYDDTGVMPAGSSLFFDINTGRLSIRGDVYADNGYFKGKVEATSGVFKGMLDIGDNFKVDENGIMTCKGADISGAVTVESLTVPNGATVSGLVVGDNVEMGPNATISWSQLPSDVASDSDIPDMPDMSNVVRYTTIGSNSVITQTLEATNLTITGGSVNINTSDRTFDVIKFNNITSDTTLGRGEFSSTFQTGSLTCTSAYPEMSTKYIIEIAAGFIQTSGTDNGTYYDTHMGPTGIETTGSISATGGIECNRIRCGGAITPKTTKSYGCGLSDYRWSTVYTEDINASGSATISGSASMGSASITGSASMGSASASSLTTTGKVEVGGQLWAQNVYSNTTSDGRTVRVGQQGRFWALASSSRNIKHDIVPLNSNDLKAEQLYNIPVVQFKYNTDILCEDDSRYLKDMPGFIAEDIAEIYPIAADMDNGNPSDWNYRFLIPPMLKLIQDQKKEIDKLRTAINEIKGEIKNGNENASSDL